MPLTGYTRRVQKLREEVLNSPSAICLDRARCYTEIYKKHPEQPLHRRIHEAGIIRAFFAELKGWHVQYNVAAKDTLLAARKDPPSYRDLIVRAAGYSAFFTSLSPEMQSSIIERTEQRL